MAKKTLKSNKAVEKKAAAKEESKAKVVDMKKTEQPTVKAEKKAEPKVEPKKAETVKPAEKKVEAKATKEEPKKIVAKAEPKKLTAKEEAKKLTTTKEPKKIAAAKEPKKITAKEEPVKLDEAKPAVKEEPKKVTKAEPKKTEAKTTKKAPAKKAAPKAETKAAKKAEPAKAVKKAEEKPAKKAEKKAPAKKAPAKKKVDQEKLDHYNALPLDECIALMQTMNVHYNYEDYYNLLLDEADLATLEKNIIDGNNIKGSFKFAEVGCDEDLVMVTLNKVGDTMDIKAADYKELKKAINSAIKFKMKDDAEANAAEYLDEFKLSEKLLMIGQRKNMFNASEVSDLLGGDVVAYFKHFFDFAYALLPTWQYDDVKFYEDFAYAVLSQYADLFETEQLRIQIDVADLYVKHGDYQHGDEMYGYILRDNQIKDYIYYRYASVYKDIDFNKAKSIAYSSLQYVDDRYTYYPNIMEIINN